MNDKITIRAARVNANLRQADAAKAIGVSERTLANWEKGTSFPTINKLMKLCDLYGVKLGNIFFTI